MTLLEKMDKESVRNYDAIECVEDENQVVVDYLVENLDSILKENKYFNSKNIFVKSKLIGDELEISKRIKFPIYKSKKHDGYFVLNSVSGTMRCKITEQNDHIGFRNSQDNFKSIMPDLSDDYVVFLGKKYKITLVEHNNESVIFECAHKIAGKQTIC